MNIRTIAALAVLLSIHTPAWSQDASPPVIPPFQDLSEDIPEDFPRFYFADNPEAAQLLGRYYWYHFNTRPGTGLTLFNKEYLTTGDMWAAGAETRSGQPIQRRYRDLLLQMEMDRSGYVHTHQHVSHAHETGWPFPLWMQVVPTYEGVTFGWHFQDSGPPHYWIWGLLKDWQTDRNTGASATEGWELHNLASGGIVDSAWQLTATGPSPRLTTPSGIVIDASNAPFLQIRWNRTGERPPAVLPYIEWQRDEDSGWSEDQRVYFRPEKAAHSGQTGYLHSMMTMHTHPDWEGDIKRMRLSLAPGDSDVIFDLDSFFTVYDTRHTINNPIFIMASWNYFRWTGDIAFLQENIDRMRTALRYQATVLGGLEHGNIRNEWVGHDGISGWIVHDDGTRTQNPGHGIGGNYWDILPFGWDDMIATSQYYRSLVVMATLEEAIENNPGWGIPPGALALAPEELRQHAEEVKATANEKFWDEERGRFVGAIDRAGEAHDYGFTFANLEAIWYGIATEDHARSILDWVSGKRVIEGETSTGDDIYRWRFGPRATTVRNLEWYGQGWGNPASIPWGGQVQDGGAVLGFSFYDLWARLQIYGPDDAWQRLGEILEWEKEVRAGGGYRAYYADGRHGNTLQGGGTAGGLGIDKEFYESILLPSIVTYGFLGLDPRADGLRISPNLPGDVPEMGIRNLLYHGTRMDLRVSEGEVVMDIKEAPVYALHLELPGRWQQEGTGNKGSRFTVDKAGIHQFAALSE